MGTKGMWTTTGCLRKHSMSSTKAQNAPPASLPRGDVQKGVPEPTPSKPVPETNNSSSSPTPSNRPPPPASPSPRPTPSMPVHNPLLAGEPERSPMLVMHHELRRMCRQLRRWQHLPRSRLLTAATKHSTFNQQPALYAEQHQTRMLKGHFLRKSTHFYLICNLGWSIV